MYHGRVEMRVAPRVFEHAGAVVTNPNPGGKDMATKKRTTHKVEPPTLTEFAKAHGGVVSIEPMSPEATGAPTFCTRYTAGGGRHHLQHHCPEAPAVPCSPECATKGGA